MEFNCEEIFTMELKVFPQRKFSSHKNNYLFAARRRKFIASLQAANLKKI